MLTSGCDVVWRLDHVQSGDEAWLAGYSHRKVIDLLPPDNGPLDAYPFPIVAPVDAELAAATRPDGHDLVVTAADGLSVMSYELEKYDPTGKLALWVNIPRLDGAVQLYLYYGGPPTTTDASSTWSLDCVAVWHFSDTTLQEARDSTANAQHLEQIVPTNRPAIVAGLAGDARSFFGGEDMDTVGIAYQPGLGAFSYSAWVMTSSLPSMVFEGVFYNGGTTTNDPGFDIERTSADWRSDLVDGLQSTRVQFSGSGTELLGRWVQLAGVVDRDLHTHIGYVDGVMRDSSDIASLGKPDHDGHLTVGSLDGTRFYNGLIDELRIYSRAVPAAWFATERAVLTDPMRHVTIGPEQSAP